MTIDKLTVDQEKWMLGQIKPSPEVFVLAYAGTSFKEWKLVSMCSKAEYYQREDWEEIARRTFPSATVIKVFICDTPSS